MITMQFADIKNDIAFRKIFGNENKKEILISFLNAVLKLEGNQQISWVEILNPYQVPIVLGAKSTILDVKAKDKAGKEYIVEMQVTEKIGFAKRVVYYTSKSYSSQLNVGEAYGKLKPTIFIGILNFEFLESESYLSRHLILDADTQEHKLKDLDFNFIELPKFNKKEEELKTLVEKWVFFIKNAENLTVLPQNLDDEGLKSAYTEADRHLWTKKELAAYEYAQMRETDEKAREMFVLEKGKHNKQIEVATKAIRKGFDNETIADLTDLNMEQIEKLRKETK
ncbi:MAG: Rpn family recombination-promoting nuclease/putative transposase [Bacteroidetes bacterium]|nr:MAG: Rpn family recombination-promoting nuclease/putative transposase [Bacteroidota bacterium]